jgi:predicted Zn finger-like uncharacterized protein
MSGAIKERLQISCPHCHRTYVLRVERERVKSSATTARCGRCGKRFNLPQRVAARSEPPSGQAKPPLRKRITRPSMRRVLTTPPDAPIEAAPQREIAVAAAARVAPAARIPPPAPPPRVLPPPPLVSGPPSAAVRAWLDFAGQRLTQLETERTPCMMALEWLLVEDQLRD